jgi:hypothetical protein
VLDVDIADPISQYSRRHYHPESCATLSSFNVNLSVPTANTENAINSPKFMKEKVPSSKPKSQIVVGKPMEEKEIKYSLQ